MAIDAPQHELIRKTLELRAGQAADARAFADATIEIWQEIALHLTPVIGAQGLVVLFNRSLHLTSANFHWLSTLGHTQDTAQQLPKLRTLLAEQSVTEAAQASGNWFVMLTELLASLIGESLTARLLEPVWARAQARQSREQR